MPKSSVFERTPTITTHAQMMARLAERTAKLNPGGSGGSTGKQADESMAIAAIEPSPSPDGSKPSPTPSLLWEAPVKATQTTADGRYQLRATQTKGQLLYWAWSQQKPIPKLLGYPATPEAARALCQAHSDAQT